MTDLLHEDPVAVSPRRAQTRERLMAAATAVFAERGILAASVEEICEAAGFTRGAFYSNFADKDDLVLTLIRQIIRLQYAAAERSIAQATSAPAGTTDPYDLVAHALAVFELTGRSDRESFLTEQELLLYAARQPALRRPYLDFVQECDRQLAVLITDALAHAGLEFSVPFDQAIDLLSATHTYVHLRALFSAEADQQLMHTLLMAITRPTASGS